MLQFVEIGQQTGSLQHWAPFIEAGSHIAVVWPHKSHDPNTSHMTCSISHVITLAIWQGASFMPISYNVMWPYCQDLLLEFLRTLPHSTCSLVGCSDINTLKPRQNCCRFADDILKCIFLNENVTISLEFSLKLFIRFKLTIFQHLSR